MNILGYQPTSGDRVRIVAAGPGAHNRAYVGMTGVARITPHGLRVNFDLTHEDADGLLLASVLFCGNGTITLEHCIAATPPLPLFEKYLRRAERRFAERQAAEQKARRR